MQKFKIPRVSDISIVDVFKMICVEHKASAANIVALGEVTIGQVNLVDEPTGPWKALLDLDSYLIENLTITIGNLLIQYFRGGSGNPDTKSPIYDEILLNRNGDSDKPTNEEKLRVVSILNSKLSPFHPDRVAGVILPQEDRDVIAIHHSTLERLERLNEDLIRKGLEYKATIEEDSKNKIDTARAELKEHKAALDIEYASKLELLATREKAFEAKLKLIDDRNNTHARREIRDKMLTDVKSRIENFGVSPITEKKRTPVFIGMILLGVSLLCLLVFTGIEISKSSALGQTEFFLLWGRMTLLSFGFLGTILFYIKWQISWAARHADSEFQLQQFYLDVNRSNWVIESCIEWKKETDSQFPKALISSITNNLFSAQEKESEKIIHPADELASALMGSASKLKLKIGDNELDFDNPSKLPKSKKTSNNAD